MGAANQSAIGTLVERRTRYLILIGVFHGKPTAEAMRDAITSTLQALPARLRRTLTMGSGQGTCTTSTDHRAHRHASVLLRRALSVAAWQQ
jgi:IS30 family transposase